MALIMSRSEIRLIETPHRMSMIMGSPEVHDPNFLPSSGSSIPKGWDLMHCWFNEELAGFELTDVEIESRFLNVPLNHLWDHAASHHAMCARNHKWNRCSLGVYSPTFQASMRIQRFIKNVPVMKPYNAKKKLHRETLLLSICNASKQELPATFSLVHLLNDEHGGILRQFIAPLL